MADPQAAPAGMAAALIALVGRFLQPARHATTGAVHVRDAGSTQALLNSVVVASLPCFLVGTWNLGLQTNIAMMQFGVDAVPGWRGVLLAVTGLGYDPTDPLACFVHGLAWFLPILLVALATGAVCEAALASGRRRAVDHGLLSVAWIYALILPATVAAWQVALGMVFAIVIGKGIFGGTGRYLINPSILGLAFLVFSYPGLIHDAGAWIPVPGYDDPTTIELAVDEGGVAALDAVGYEWWELFLGMQPGPVGVTSLAACLLGALYLLAVGWASWRILLGSLLGLIATVAVLNTFGPDTDPMFDVPWYWHVVIGGWAFVTVFIATDPVAAAMTRPGRLGFGFLVGALTVVVRLTNPAYYEGAIFAVLLASIFAPLIDWFVVEASMRRRRQRAGPA